MTQTLRTPACPNGVLWTAEEDARLRELLATGMSQREIAARIGRSYDSTIYRISVLRRGADGPRRKRRVWQRPPDPGETASERWMRERINASPAGWTPAADLTLAVGLCSGRRVAAVAEELGRTEAAVVGRFRDLVQEPGIEAQGLMLREVRRRAELWKP